MSALPRGWVEDEASTICELVQSGGTPKEGFIDKPGVPFLKVYNIVDQKIDFEYRPQFIDVDIHRSSMAKSQAFPGDVLMNIVGPPLGKVAVIPDSFPNQVGKGAISGWREIIVPQLDDIGLWPFDGSLAHLLDTRPCVIAETYPGDVYRQLGMPRGGWSKRRQGDRQRIAKMMIPRLGARPHLNSHALLPTIEDGFGADKAGEDRFDAVVGLFGMLDVVDGRRDEGVPDIDGVRRWEGWILGHHRNDER